MCFEFFFNGDKSTTVQQLPSALGTTAIQCTQVDETPIGVLRSTPNKVYLYPRFLSSFIFQCFGVGAAVVLLEELHLSQYVFSTVDLSFLKVICGDIY